MTAATLYLLFVILPNLHNTDGAVALSGTTAFLALIIFIIFSVDEEFPIFGQAVLNKIRSIMIIAFCIFTTLWLVSILTPSKEQIYISAGAYAALNSEELKKLPGNVLRAANNYLEQLNKELTDKAKKESK